MSLWRTTRNEVAGAWRSVRYDIGRRTPDDAHPGPAPGPVPDVTSTGMNTFAGVAVDPYRREEFDPYVPPPRRVLAVSAFGVLAIAGAAGTYFAVVGGLGAVLHPAPAGHGPYPLAVDAPTSWPGADVDSVAGMGQGTVVAPAGPAAKPATGTAATPPATPTTPPTAPVPATTTPRVPQPPAPDTPGSSDCDCLTPPVPTPTAPPAPGPAPEPTPSASPSPSGSESEPTPSDSGSEPPSAEPSGSGGGGPARPHRLFRDN
jgi:hypothetical protein